MPTIPAAMPEPVWGVLRTLDGCIILSENITKAGQAYEVRDQQNRLVKKVHYDTLITLTLTVEAAEGITFSDGEALKYNGVNWMISQAGEVGSYQDKRKLEITAERGAHWIVPDPA